MQTTLRMNDDLIKRAKALAAVDGQSLTAFIEDAIRRRLEARQRAITAERPSLPTFAGGGGLLPGVDLDDSSSLTDVMEHRDTP